MQRATPHPALRATFPSRAGEGEPATLEMCEYHSLKSPGEAGVTLTPSTGQARRQETCECLVGERWTQGEGGAATTSSQIAVSLRGVKRRSNDDGSSLFRSRTCRGSPWCR